MKDKICLFIGSHRPKIRRDSGEDLVRALLANGLNISTVYLRPGDPLRKRMPRSCTAEDIPAILRQPRRRILQSFQDGDFSEEWEEFRTGFSAQQFSMGILYFGSWMPPEIFEVPKLGFINFHPGPLPALRGFEAETWAILQDMKYFHGTAHRVSREYDGGEIIWRTPSIRIRSRETPASLLARTCYAGIKNIDKLVRLLHRDGFSGQIQIMAEGIDASVKLMRSFASVDWSRDSLAVLDRKNRAFNGQIISVDFTLEHQGEKRIIRDIKVMPGRFKGGLGTCLGSYARAGIFYGQPIYQALDGQVVFRLYPAGTVRPDRATVFADYNDRLELDLRERR